MAEIISSVNNEKIKEIAKLQQKKFRDIEKKFLIEGEKAVNEAILNNVEIEEIFMLENFKGEINSTKIIIVNEKVMSKICDTKSACNVLAIAKQKNFDVQNLKKYKKIALFENIKDAGNLGTILRSAAAFNLDAIILSGEYVDLYNPKVIRSAVGNFLKIPIFEIRKINELKKYLQNHNFYATLMPNKQTKTIKNYEFKKPFVIMFGSEADGLTKDALKIKHEKITIEINPKTESLNLAVSASIIFYEMFKIK